MLALAVMPIQDLEGVRPMMRRRRVGVVILLPAMTLAALAGGAWACTGVTQSFGIAPQAGVAGSTVTVRGQAVRRLSGPATVDIHWNRIDGPALTTVAADPRNDGTFTTDFRIPDVPPGVYVVAAVNGTVGVARTTFEVTPSSGKASPTPAAAVAAAQAVGLNSRSQGSSLPSVAIVLGASLVCVLGAFALLATRRRRASYSAHSRPDSP